MGDQRTPIFWGIIEIEVSTGSSMALVGESVIRPFSKPHHHMRRIPLWAQVSPIRPYIGRENVLEICGDFFDQNCVEVSREFHTCVEDAGDVLACVEGCGRLWNVGE